MASLRQAFEHQLGFSWKEAHTVCVACARLISELLLEWYLQVAPFSASIPCRKIQKQIILSLVNQVTQEEKGTYVQASVLAEDWGMATI